MKEFTIPNLADDDSRTYQVDPMEYLLRRVRNLGLGPPDEIEYLMLRIRQFLRDEQFPGRYRTAFFHQLHTWATSTAVPVRRNAQHVLRDLQPDDESAASTVARLIEAGRWSLPEEEYRRRSEEADAAMRQRRQPAHYFLPGTDGERIYYAIGPHETEQMRIDSQRADAAPAVPPSYSEGFAALMLKVTPDDPFALQAMASSHLQRGELDRALPYLERLLELRPADAALHAQYGGALVKSGRPEAGLEHLDAALELDPSRATTLMNKVHVLVVLERNAEARVAAQAFVRLDAPPEHPLAYELLSGLAADAAQAGEWAVAAELADGAVRMRPDSEPALLLRASIARERGDAVAEAEALDRAVDGPGASAEAWSMRAASLLRRGDAAGAVSSYERAVALDPDNGRLWNDLGSSLQRVGEHDRARYCFERSIDLDPHDAMHWSNLGGAILNQASTAEDLNEAARLFNKALEMHPEQVGAMFGLAVAALYRGRNAEAEAGLREVLRREPGHYAAGQVLAQLRVGPTEGGAR